MERINVTVEDEAKANVVRFQKAMKLKNLDLAINLILLGLRDIEETGTKSKENLEEK